MSETEEQIDRQTEIRHLLRSVKTALELAIVARAPTDLVNRLGRLSGLLDAVSQLADQEGPWRTMLPGLVADGLATISAWEKWHQSRTVVA